MQNTGTIKDWQFTPTNFNPNEFQVVGTVVDHNVHSMRANEPIRTNHVTAIDRTETEEGELPGFGGAGPVDFSVTTRSGSKYRLQGLPAADWVVKLAEQGTTVSRFMADLF